MPRRSPFVIQFTETERAELEARCKEYTSPYRDVVRAKIVLLASQGLGNDRIAAQLGFPRQIASKWRNGSVFNGCPVSTTDHVAGDQPAFPPTSWLRSRRWPVNQRRLALGGGRRCHLRLAERQASRWGNFTLLIARLPVRRGLEIDRGPERNNAGRIDGAVTLVVVTLDMVEIDRLADAWPLVELARV